MSSILLLFYSPSLIRKLKKILLFHFKSSFVSCNIKILEFQYLTFHNLIKCLSMRQEKQVLLNNFKVNIVCSNLNSLYITTEYILSRNSTKNKARKPIPGPSKNPLKNKQNFYWKMNFSKQADYIGYVIPKLFKHVKICLQFSSGSFLQRILLNLKRVWN